MERLTEEMQIGPFASLKDEAEAKPGAFADYDCLYAHMMAVTRLKQYEDTGLTPEEITDFEKRWRDAVEIAGLCKQEGIDHLFELIQAEKDGRLTILPPNPPLTLEELQEMDGEPIWIYYGEGIGLYDVFCGVSTDGIVQFHKLALPISTYERSWLAYRRKPEEERP